VNPGALLCLALLLIIAGVPSQIRADQPPEEAETSIEDQWREQLIAAHQEVVDARKRHEAAQKAYKIMRSRNRMRGEPRRLVVEELELATAALPKVERELEELTEAARRAGVSRGSMRVDESDLAPVASD